MRILYCRVFGLGNAICAVPALKLIRQLQPDATLDVMVGNHPDDFGALDVMRHLKASGLVNNVWTNISLGQRYDVTFLAMPYDNRWRDCFNFNADVTLDGRARPDPKTFGFGSWMKHEVEYQVENVQQAKLWDHCNPPWAFDDWKIPDCNFMDPSRLSVKNSVYLGMGYKKDASGFWSQKHWGTEKYAALVNRMLDEDQDLEVITTGDILDIAVTIKPFLRLLKKEHLEGGRFVHFTRTDLQSAFEYVSACETFVGNDTGMAHVAASFDLGVVPYFRMENAWTKSRPWCERWEVVKGHDHDVSVDEFYAAFRRVHYGEA